MVARTNIAKAEAIIYYCWVAEIKFVPDAGIDAIGFHHNISSCHSKDGAGSNGSFSDFTNEHD